jgi:hypothetical protein
MKVFDARYISEKLKGRFTLYVTFPFRRETSPFSKVSHGCLNGHVHSNRNVSVKSQFRSVSERECLTRRHGSDATSVDWFLFFLK